MKTYWIWDNGPNRDGPDDWQCSTTRPWFADYKSDYEIEQETLKEVVLKSDYDSLLKQIEDQKNTDSNYNDPYSAHSADSCDDPTCNHY